MLLVGTVREELKLPVVAELPIRVWVKLRVRCLGAVEPSVEIVGFVVVEICKVFASLLVVSFGWDRVVVWVGVRIGHVEVSYAGVVCVEVCKGTSVEVKGSMVVHFDVVVVCWGLSLEPILVSDVL